MTLKKSSILLDSVGFALLLGTICILIFKSLFIDYYDDFNYGNLAVVIFTMFSFFALSSFLKNIMLHSQVTIRFELSAMILAILLTTAIIALVFIFYGIFFAFVFPIMVFYITFFANLTLKKKLKWNKTEDEMEYETPNTMKGINTETKAQPFAAVEDVKRKSKPGSIKKTSYNEFMGYLNNHLGILGVIVILVGGVEPFIDLIKQFFSN